MGLGLSFSGGAAFSPLDLAPAAWFDAGKTSGVDGNNLATWTDLSGNGFHLNAQIGTNVFHAAGGSNDTARVTFATGPLYRASPLIAGADAARTCFCVSKKTADGALVWVDGRWGYNGFALGMGAGFSNKREVVVVGDVFEKDTTSNSTTNWEQSCAINEGGSSQRLRIGESEHTLSPNNHAVASATQSFSVGGDNPSTLPFVGDISEVIIYGSLLSSADITKVENYLLAKYSV